MFLGKYPVLSCHPPPPQKDSRTISGSHVLKRDEVMCGTDGLGLMFGRQGLEFSVLPCLVQNVNLRLGTNSQLATAHTAWTALGGGVIHTVKSPEQSVLTQHRAGRRCRHGAARHMPTDLWWFSSVPDLPLFCLASQGSGERVPVLHPQGEPQPHQLRMSSSWSVILLPIHPPLFGGFSTAHLLPLWSVLEGEVDKSGRPNPL